jgi:hypothetical protein
MDRNEIFILETANRKWVYRKTSKGSISNRLTIGEDGDEYATGKTYNFSRKHLEPVYSYFSASKKRLESTASSVRTADNISDLMNELRMHSEDAANPLTQCSVSSTCMHAGGLIGDHTTASMMVELGDITRVWLTGSSTPCISLFKPYGFGNTPIAPVFIAGDSEGEAYWKMRENFHRSVIGKKLPQEYYEERDSLEQKWMKAAGGADLPRMHQLSCFALQEESAFYEKWLALIPEETNGGKRFLSYWGKKNAQMHADSQSFRLVSS